MFRYVSLFIIDMGFWGSLLDIVYKGGVIKVLLKIHNVLGVF
jgi:hypothetical protein